VSTQEEKPNETLAPEGAEPDHLGTGPAEHTAETSVNQEKLATDALSQVSPETRELVERIDRRINDIQSLMIEKERQQLLYVYEKIPKPYYNRWKAEANDIFALTVHVNRRRARVLKAG
jgi:hypothetical protein